MERVVRRGGQRLDMMWLAADENSVNIKFPVKMAAYGLLKRTFSGANFTNDNYSHWVLGDEHPEMISEKQ